MKFCWFLIFFQLSNFVSSRKLSSEENERRAKICGKEGGLAFGEVSSIIALSANGNGNETGIMISSRHFLTSSKYFSDTTTKANWSNNSPFTANCQKFDSIAPPEILNSISPSICPYSSGCSVFKNLQTSSSPTIDIKQVIILNRCFKGSDGEEFIALVELKEEIGVTNFPCVPGAEENVEKRRFHDFQPPFHFLRGADIDLGNVSWNSSLEFFKIPKPKSSTPDPSILFGSLNRKNVIVGLNTAANTNDTIWFRKLSYVSGQLCEHAGICEIKEDRLVEKLEDKVEEEKETPICPKCLVDPCRPTNSRNIGIRHEQDINTFLNLWPVIFIFTTICCCLICIYRK